MELNTLIHTTLSNYFDFLKIPSISIEQKGSAESIKWLHQQFTKLGANQVNMLDDFGNSLVIVAKFDGNSDTTLLIYNHYDVQPIGNIDLWHTNPFHSTLKDEKLFC